MFMKIMKIMKVFIIFSLFLSVQKKIVLNFNLSELLTFSCISVVKIFNSIISLSLSYIGKLHIFDTIM